MIGGDDRPAHGLGFRHDAAEGFRPCRGRDDDIGKLVGRRHVRAVIEDAHHVLEARTLDLGLDTALVPALSPVGAKEQAGNVAAPEPLERFDQHALALPAAQPAGQQDDLHVVG